MSAILMEVARWQHPIDNDRVPLVYRQLPSLRQPVTADQIVPCDLLLRSHSERD